MTVNKKSPPMRFGIFLLLSILLISLSVAFTPTSRHGEAPPPSPQATEFISDLEVGSTSGIFIGSGVIVLIVVVPLIFYLLAANKKEQG